MFHSLLGLFALCFCGGIAGVFDNTGQEEQLAQIKAIVCALITKGISTDVLDKTTIHRLRKYDIDLEKMSKDDIKSMCDNVNQMKLIKGAESESETQQPDSKQNIEQSSYETNTRIDEEMFKDTHKTESAPSDENSPNPHRVISSSLIIALNSPIFPQKNHTDRADAKRAENIIDTLTKTISQDNNNQIKRTENDRESRDLTNLIFKLINSKSIIKSSDHRNNRLYDDQQIMSKERPKINVIIIKENDFMNGGTSSITKSAHEDTTHTKTLGNCKSNNNCNLYDAKSMEKFIQATFQKLLNEAAKNMAEDDRNKMSESKKAYHENLYSNQPISPTNSKRTNDRRKKIRINKLQLNSAQIPNDYWSNQGRQGSVYKINDKLDFSASKDSLLERSQYEPNHFSSGKHRRTYPLPLYSKSSGLEKVPDMIPYNMENSPEQQNHLDMKKHTFDSDHKSLLSYQDLDEEIAEMKKEHLERHSDKEMVHGEPNEDYSYRQNLSDDEEKLENIRDDAEKKYALDIVLGKYKHRHNIEEMVEKNMMHQFMRNHKKPVENINLNMTGLALLNEIKVMILNEIKKDMNVSRATDVNISRTGGDLSSNTKKTTDSMPINTSLLIGTLKQDILNTIKLYLSNASSLIGNADKSSSNAIMKPYGNGSETHPMPCMKSLDPDEPDSDMMVVNYIQDGNRNYLYNEPNPQIESSLHRNEETTIETDLDRKHVITSEYAQRNGIEPVSYTENTNTWHDSNHNNLNYNTKRVDDKNNKYLWDHLNPSVYKRKQLSKKNMDMEAAQNMNQRTGMPIEEFIKTQEKLNLMLEKFLASQNGLKKDDSIEIM